MKTAKVLGLTIIAVAVAIGVNNVSNGKVPAFLLALLVFGTLVGSAIYIKDDSVKY